MTRARSWTEWTACDDYGHSGMATRTIYLPLYAEKRCGICGYWRGEHTGGDGSKDDQMQCPSTFEPEPEKARS